MQHFFRLVYSILIDLLSGFKKKKKTVTYFVKSQRNTSVTFSLLSLYMYMLCECTCICIMYNQARIYGGFRGFKPPRGRPPPPKKKKKKKKGKKKRKKERKKERKKNARWRETLSSANIVRRYSTHLVT